jgi:hypothetical protein
MLVFDDNSRLPKAIYRIKDRDKDGGQPLEMN